jgi:hypothetical protein
VLHCPWPALILAQACTAKCRVLAYLVGLRMSDLSVRSDMIVWLCPRAGCLQIRELVKNFKAKTAALKPTSKL